MSLQCSNLSGRSWKDIFYIVGVRGVGMRGRERRKETRQQKVWDKVVDFMSCKWPNE